jgi:hypothetical protein
LSLYNCETKITHSNLKILSAYGGSLSVDGSVIWLLESGGNSTATITRSNVGYLLVYSEGDHGLVVNGTSISSLLLTCRRNLLVDVIDSSIGECYVNHRVWSSENGTLIFARTSIGDLRVYFTPLNSDVNRSIRINFEESSLKGNLTVVPNEFRADESRRDDLSISGGISFGTGSALNLGGSSGFTLSRRFPVSVTLGGVPLAGVPLRLLDANGTVWEGVTGEDGTAAFDLKTPRNRESGLSGDGSNRSGYVLTVDYGGVTYSKEVGLLSDTPITVRVRVRLYDTLGYGILAVSSVLALILAAGYTLMKLVATSRVRWKEDKS